jgi:hypothetical protein
MLILVDVQVNIMIKLCSREAIDHRREFTRAATMHAGNTLLLQHFIVDDMIQLHYVFSQKVIISRKVITYNFTFRVKFNFINNISIEHSKISKINGLF